MAEPPLKTDHNVYILGAGFSAPAGMPVIRVFMPRMREAAEWLLEAKRPIEAKAIRDVLAFRERAAAAAYRTRIDVENVEELFGLASAMEAITLRAQMRLAIAATLDCCKQTFAPEPFNLTIPETLYNTGILARTKWKPTADPSMLAPGAPKMLTARVHPVEACVAGMLGLLGTASKRAENSVISLNYDLEVEAALDTLGLRASYGFSTKKLTNKAPYISADAPLRLLKLHGSLNWVRPGYRGGRLTAHPNYDHREGAPVLIPPTWRKDFPAQLAEVWDTAVRVLREATRIIVLGFSLPPTDLHIRYLLAAGLAGNISLRQIVFVDPDIEKVSKRALGLFRPELVERGALAFQGSTASTFLLSVPPPIDIGRTRLLIP
jgi:hypothetical protein